jgi:hypothetical protein
MFFIAHHIQGERFLLFPLRLLLPLALILFTHYRPFLSFPVSSAGAACNTLKPAPDAGFPPVRTLIPF